MRFGLLALVAVVALLGCTKADAPADAGAPAVGTAISAAAGARASASAGVALPSMASAVAAPPAAASAAACDPTCMYNGRCARIQEGTGPCCEPITKTVGGVSAEECRALEKESGPQGSNAGQAGAKAK